MSARARSARRPAQHESRGRRRFPHAEPGLVIAWEGTAGYTAANTAIALDSDAVCPGRIGG